LRNNPHLQSLKTPPNSPSDGVLRGGTALITLELPCNDITEKDKKGRWVKETERMFTGNLCILHENFL
jgi:hypothetical protein